MRRDTLVQLAALLCMLGFLAGGGLLATKVSASAGRNRLVYADAAEDGDPPEVALGIAMGAFRGIFVNWLWIRANDLKEQGKYHESVDLARTITRLQPRFPRVWTFQAWNLAYNISVSTNTPQERWNWVKAGIDLIRKEGIPANPGSVLLYKEVGWIHMHKIQGYMDDAHVYYKRQFAAEWTYVMGAPPKFEKELRDPAKRAEFYVEKWLKPIAEAPDSLEALYAKRPSCKALVERMEREAGVKPDMALLQAIETQKALARMAGGMKSKEVPAIPGPLGQIINDPATIEDLRLVVRTIRKALLRNEYAMDPDRMIKYTLEYGPLDWRHASAHAVYWSSAGSDEALLRINNFNKTDQDLINNDRLTVQALQDLFRTGTLYFDILNPEFYRQLPNTDYTDKYGQVMRELKERSFYDRQTRAYSFYTAGYENFLRDAVRFLYRKGDRASADRYYKMLRTDTTLNQNNQLKRSEDFKQTIEEFVVSEIKNGDRETSPVVATQEIYGAFASAFLDGLLVGNEEVFNNNMQYAKTFHQYFQDAQNYTTYISKEASSAGRLGFPPFNYMCAQAFAGMIEQAGLPDGAIMYRAAPPELSGRAYVFLERTVMKSQMDAASPGSFASWFPSPSPAELEHHRREMIEATRGLSNDAGTVEQK